MEKSRLTGNEMRERFDRDVPVADIATEAGLSITWTYRKLRLAGADVGRQELKPCPIPIEQLAEEYYAGASILALANRHGLYYKRVRNLLLEHRVTLRPSTRAPSFRRQA